jgi:hypothetical protein
MPFLGFSAACTVVLYRVIEATGKPHDENGRL